MPAMGSIASRGPLGPVTDAVWQARVLVEAGVIGPIRPDKLLRIGHRFLRWGASPALAAAAAAIHHPDRVAISDELGELSFSETHRRSNALARALRSEGIEAGDGVAILCRNHRYFVEATIACSKLGAVALYLNTSFAGPQLAEVLEREGPRALIFDREFEQLLAEAGRELHRYVAWGGGGAILDPALEELIERSDSDSDLDPPPDTGRFVILTSGTTGAPKGAQRPPPQGLGSVAALLSRIPRRSGESVMIAAPLFHSWGLLHLILGLPLAATMILRRRFDPETTLAACDEHGARTLVLVPVMMQRILELPVEVRDRYRLAELEVTAASGSALPGDLATAWMDAFGDNLYNLYGSTEVSWATIATPKEMREAPGTAGRPPRGTVVRIVDELGREVPTGDTGRIFVGNETAFDGYTGGGDKERMQGLLSSGDVGHFDERGLLFVDGRDDEMIVSGGENVFPLEVEDLLSRHPAVADVAALGVEDEEFGQRLRAFVVLAPGAAVTEDELKGYVREHLARYKVPREVVFVPALPRNATGKVLKRELADEGAPG